MVAPPRFDGLEQLIKAPHRDDPVTFLVFSVRLRTEEILALAGPIMVPGNFITSVGGQLLAMELAIIPIEPERYRRSPVNSPLGHIKTIAPKMAHRCLCLRHIALGIR
jgi:hypothetical protein